MNINDHKSRVNRLLVIVALLISVISLSTAYAAMSTTLKINSNAILHGSNWRIRFTNATLINKVGSAKELKTPSISDELLTFDIELFDNNDKIEYRYEVSNEGDFDAKLSLDPVISGIPDEIKDKVRCTITDLSGALVKEGDVLLKGEQKQFLITFELLDNSFLINDSKKLEITAIMLYEQK